MQFFLNSSLIIRLASKGIKNKIPIKTIGLIGVLGAGAYVLTHKKKIFNNSSVNTTPTTALNSNPKPKWSSKLKTSLGSLGKKQTEVGPVNPLHPTPIGTPTMAGYGKPKKIGILGKIIQMKDRIIYGTPYMIKEPVYPVSVGASSL